MTAMKRIPFVAVWCALAVPTGAVEYPGPPPGPTQATCSATDATLQNDAIAMRWTFGDGHLRPGGLTHKQAAQQLALADSECFRLVLGQTPDSRSRTLNASELKLADPPAVKRLEPTPDAVRLGDRFGGWELSARLLSTAPDFEVLWRATLRDGANYIRQEVTVQTQREPIELVEVALLEMRVPQAVVAGRVDGSPVVSESLFFGVEQPAAASTVLGADTVRCSYPYHSAVTATEPLTLGSVIGVFPPGQRRRGFLHYLERERAHPYRPFLHHNNGEQIGLAYWELVRLKKTAEATAFRARQEQAWRELIDRIGQELVERRGARVDAFAHDYQWDDENLVWQFHEGFPNGFKPLIDVAAKHKSGLGIWFSPWGGYPGKAARVKAGREQGLETNQGGLSLAGPRYYARFRAACLNLMREHGVRYFKFDGFAGSNSPAGAGEYRSDVEALWRLMGELRAANPEVFINPSSGTWASPFWLLRADSIWRGGGDTGIAGAKGSERQQWITYRDFEVHNRVLVNGPLYPISSLMIHGIMINSGGRVKTFVERDMIDEIRSFFASGVNLQELYVTPDLMTPAAWDALAEAANWSRANADVLADTHWIGGDPAKGEIYGWASWAKRKGILSLRNPSDQPANIEIDIAEAFELPSGAAQSYLLRSPWKKSEGKGSRSRETSDVTSEHPNSHEFGYEKDATAAPIRLAAAQHHRFKLQPFEVVVLDATPE